MSTPNIQGTAKALLFGALLGAATFGGCTGNIGGPIPGETASTRTAGGGPAAGVGGTKGSGGGITPTATDPGRVTMHRLNLAEYDNTMRDLLGTTTHPSVDFNFPPDDRGDDFDNTADVLTVSPLHVTCYNTAATALVTAAMAAPAQRALLVSCDLAAGGATCARSSLSTFLPRAWRRPVTSAEIDRLMALVTSATTQGDPTEVGFDLAVRAALLSPNFIYRPEIDPSPTSLTPHPLTEYELASRMSYFLWSSMPDAQLFAAAQAGNLHEPATLTSQVARMLADPKAQALIDNFAGQWLFIRLIDEAMPDPTLFPQFDASLQAAFKSETELLFREIAFNGLPADQLINAQFTFANDRLAQYYGLPPVGSTTPQRVDLSGNTQRRGFLSHGGILTVNSHPDRTSPVLRGKYVLTELLCENIAPPPANVNIMITPDPTGHLTLRQVLEGHITNPECASCHSLMDPIGFGMENYNAVGAYRTLDGTLPIDSSGTLPSGQKFSGLIDLTKIIGSDPGFPKCMTTKLYTYALGRAMVLTDPNNMDVPSVAAVSSGFVTNGLKFQNLATGIVMAPTFLNRRGDGG
jgi:Protein of unknown function (DUF1592)/Protein of unknown function (DUF1588)/Protein of unknown function (DUF1595)/Protein of unknown function (DUF1587)/Protein of unknown function (DUF1585)